MCLCICVWAQKSLEKGVSDSTVDNMSSGIGRKEESFNFHSIHFYVLWFFKNNFIGGKKTPLSRKGVKEIPDLCEASLEQCREALKQALGSSYWMRNWPAFRDKLPSIGDLTKPEEWRENHIILQKVWGEWKAKEFLREVILSMNLKEEVKFCWLKRRKKVSRRV